MLVTASSTVVGPGLAFYFSPQCIPRRDWVAETAAECPRQSLLACSGVPYHFAYLPLSPQKHLLGVTIFQQNQGTAIRHLTEKISA